MVHEGRREPPKDEHSRPGITKLLLKNRRRFGNDRIGPARCHPESSRSLHHTLLLLRYEAETNLWTRQHPTYDRCTLLHGLPWPALSDRPGRWSSRRRTRNSRIYTNSQATNQSDQPPFRR